MKKRVVVTGMGVVTSIGIGKDEFWNKLITGKSGISEVTSFDTSSFENHRGGEIKNFDPKQFMSEAAVSKMGRGSHLAIGATKLAVQDALLKFDKLNDIGVSFGTTMGEVNELEKIDEKWIQQGEGTIGEFDFTRYLCSLIPASVAKEFGFNGPNAMNTNACAAGNCAIGYAFDLIRSGRASKMVAGGADPFSRIAFVGFSRLGSVAPDFPRPFDKDRKGMMVGEGAGVLILESLDDALERKAPIYAEILGYGLSCDAGHITVPDPAGKGMILAMTKALDNAGVDKDFIDYINVHGTGTKGNDAAETFAIKELFGSKPKVLVSSSKSMLGHTMGAASAIEAAACVLAVKNNIAPPTMNIREIDPIVTFDVLPNKAKKAEINIAMNNGSAFGGNNASVIFGKYGEDNRP